MNDRELLEAAAKAIGERVVRESEHGLLLYGIEDAWNPLADDGDAFRLAVKLRIGVQWWESMPEGVAGRIDFDRNGVILMSNVHDKAAMLRRAIVRAAAAMAGESDEP